MQGYDLIIAHISMIVNIKYVILSSLSMVMLKNG